MMYFNLIIPVCTKELRKCNKVLQKVNYIPVNTVLNLINIHYKSKTISHPLFPYSLVPTYNLNRQNNITYDDIIT